MKSVTSIINNQLYISVNAPLIFRLIESYPLPIQFGSARMWGRVRGANDNSGAIRIFVDEFDDTNFRGLLKRDIK